MPKEREITTSDEHILDFEDLPEQKKEEIWYDLFPNMSDEEIADQFEWA